MATGSSVRRVVVVGGGVLGVSAAVQLARAGVRVQLVTEHELSSGASGRSLSWLNSSGQRSPAYHRLRILGMERYRAYAASRPAAAAYLKFDGGLRWARTGEADALRTEHERLQQIGYESEWLSPEDVRQRLPALDATRVPAEGAALNPTEGWIDLPSLVTDLVRELLVLGGEVRTGAGPVELEPQGDRVTAVGATDGQRWEADATVLATGAGVPKTLATLGFPIPDATTISVLVRTTPVQSNLRTVLNTPRVAMRPTPDGRLVLDSGWSEQEVVTHDDGTYEVHDETVQELLLEGSAVLAGNPTLGLDSVGVGPKPIPGDGEPVLGGIAGLAGCYVMFTHSGATLGLIAGELIADEIVRGEPSPLLESFRPSRFSESRNGSI